MCYVNLNILDKFSYTSQIFGNQSMKNASVINKSPSLLFDKFILHKWLEG